jgi:hypothetical protein
VLKRDRNRNGTVASGGAGRAVALVIAQKQLADGDTTSKLSWESARCCSPVRNSFSFHFRRRRRDGGDTGGFAISAATSDSLQRNARPILIGRSGQVPLLSLFRIVLGGTFRRQDTSLMSINLSIIRFQRRQTVPGVSLEGGSLAKWGYIAQLDPPCNADSCCIAIAIHV